MLFFRNLPCLYVASCCLTPLYTVKRFDMVNNCGQKCSDNGTEYFVTRVRHFGTFPLFGVDLTIVGPKE
jgi:hypothetical protein